MKINDDHLYYGAALNQIVEHEEYTAINSFFIDGKKSRNAFIVNENIGIFIKYCSKPTTNLNEYIFNFHNETFAELRKLNKVCKSMFFILVCVEDRQVCCLQIKDFLDLLKRRKTAKNNEKEAQYTIIVTIPENKKLRVYVNAPDVRGKMLGPSLLIGRNEFPNQIFKKKYA